MKKILVRPLSDGFTFDKDTKGCEIQSIQSKQGSCEEAEKSRSDADGREGEASELQQIISSYFQETSMHGLKYIVDARCKLRRIVWGLAVLGMAISLLITLKSHLSSYYSYPTRMTYNTKILGELVFPSVTVCNLSPFSKKNYNNAKLNNYTLQLYMKYILNESERINLSDPYYDRNMYEEFSKGFESDLVYMCSFNNLQDCRHNLTKVVTNDGQCFTFNSALDQSAPLTTKGTNSQSGLVFLLNVQQEHNTFGLYMGAGVKVYLNDARTGAEEGTTTFLASPGQTTQAVIRTNTLTLLGYPYKSWGDEFCVNTDDANFVNPLKFARWYSKASCLKECQAEYIYKRCQCVSITDFGNLTVCSLRKFYTCYVRYAGIFATNSSLQVKCGCMERCSVKSYNFRISTAYFPSEVIQNYLISKYHGFTAEYTRKNFLEIRIYFDQLIETEVVQVPVYTIDGILGNLGGQMGLFLGASILTITEFAEAAITFVYFFIKKYLTSRV